MSGESDFLDRNGVCGKIRMNAISTRFTVYCPVRCVTDCPPPPLRPFRLLNALLPCAEPCSQYCQFVLSNLVTSRTIAKIKPRTVPRSISLQCYAGKSFPFLDVDGVLQNALFSRHVPDDLELAVVTRFAENTYRLRPSRLQPTPIVPTPPSISLLDLPAGLTKLAVASIRATASSSSMPSLINARTESKVCGER